MQKVFSIFQFCPGGNVMLLTERERLREELLQLIGQIGRDRSALLPILQEVQRKYFHISEYCMQVIADLLDIHPVEVHSVVSFYSFLDERPQGQFVIRLCRTVTCDMAGKEHVAQQLRNDLQIDFGQTTPDGKFSLGWANCLGMCDQGPAMLVNERIFTRVTPGESPRHPGRVPADLRGPRHDLAQGAADMTTMTTIRTTTNQLTFSTIEAGQRAARGAWPAPGRRPAQGANPRGCGDGAAPASPPA